MRLRSPLEASVTAAAAVAAAAAHPLPPPRSPAAAQLAPAPAAATTPRTPAAPAVICNRTSGCRCRRRPSMPPTRSPRTARRSTAHPSRCEPAVGRRVVLQLSMHGISMIVGCSPLFPPRPAELSLPPAMPAHAAVGQRRRPNLRSGRVCAVPLLRMGQGPKHPG